MESGLTRWAGLQFKSPRRRRLGSLNSWCASSHHPFCKAETGQGVGALSSILWQERTGSSSWQVHNWSLPTQNHKSSSPNLNVPGANDVKRSSYPEENQSGSGVCPLGSLRGPSLSPLLLWLNNIVNPWPQLLTFYIHQAPSLMVGFWESML